MVIGRRVFAGAFVALAVGVSAWGQAAPAPAVVELAFKNGKTHFRSGEPMVLELTYRVSAEGCFMVSDTSPSPMDVVEVTPEEGAFRWVQGNGMGSDASSWGRVEANKPGMSQLTLNDLYRFDEKGTYTVKVRTSHLRCGEFGKAKAVELTTNAVSFEVEPYAEADERALAKSLERKIRASTDDCEADRLAKRLEYLPGDDATRAKISLTLHEKTFYPFGVDLGDSLWIARNREMVVSALEREVGDPASVVGAEAGMLSMLVELKRNKVKQQGQCCVMVLKPEPDKLLAGYRHELAVSLPRRTGDAQLVAALTVFEADARGSESDPMLRADFAAAREIVITHFGEVNEYHVGGLLQRDGKYLEDRRIVPALQKLIDGSEGVFSGNRADALKQMQRIAPEGLETNLAQEACAENPAMIKEVRDLSPVETLPGVDTCLGAKLRRILTEPVGTRSNLRLSQTLEYMARFADGAFVQEVLKAYVGRDANDRRWDQQARGAALSYLMRWDAAEAAPLLMELMPGHAGADQFVLFDVVAPALPSATGLRSFFREWIAAHPQADAGTVVYLLAEIGTSEDREYLRGKLEALHQRDAAGYSTEDGRLETELVTAQIRGRTWDYSGEKGKAIAGRECASAECRKRFDVGEQ